MKGLKAYILNTGYMYNDADYNLAYANVGTISNPSPKHKWMTVPSYCVLIDHPEAGWILYDTGCDVNALNNWPKEVMETTPYVRKSEDDNLLVQLAKLDLTPKDIGTVILSHLHMDHAGNVNLFAETAEFYISREEATHAFLKVYEFGERELFNFYLKKDVTARFKRIHYVEEDDTLFEGVDVVITPGHTKGLMGLILHLESGTLIFPMDQAKNRLNYAGFPTGIVEDTISYEKSMKKLKKLEKKYNAEVFFSHDLSQFEKMRKCPEYYE